MEINPFGQINRIEAAARVSGLALAPDGRYLALTYTLGHPNGVVVYDLSTGAEAAHFGDGVRHGKAVVFGGSSDELFYVVTTESLVDELWRAGVSSGEAERILVEETRHIRGLTSDPYGRYLAVHYNESAEVYTMHPWQSTRFVESPEGVMGIAFGHDHMFAYGQLPKQVVRFQLETWQSDGSWSGPSPAGNVILSPNGRFLGTAPRVWGPIHLHDLQKKQRLLNGRRRVIRFDDIVTWGASTFSADSKLLIAGRASPRAVSLPDLEVAFRGPTLCDSGRPALLVASTSDNRRTAFYYPEDSLVVWFHT